MTPYDKLITIEMPITLMKLDITLEILDRAANFRKLKFNLYGYKISITSIT